MVEVLRLLDEAMRCAHDVLANVAEDQRSAQTPCSGYDVERLSAHMIGGLTWFAGLPRGGTADPSTVSEPDLAGLRLGDEFAKVADEVRASWSPDVLPRTFATPFGEITGEGIAQYTVVEELGHAWDIAVASGQSARDWGDLPEAVLVLAHGVGEQVLRAPGMMGPAVPVPADAPPMDRLVGFLGRDPQRA